ncbi:hypothetical protein CQA57_07275 [Helicobacter anseris]|uniref:Uncharacterized protein n=1 Tax=Helicobacter anseris TaxID=375926 RepID=A0A3D8J383_9HELI|nr:hypothetical protein [Helicobacter anseris]RDU71992.1 hypothetical protein CQA57_07275 [Helicobacter anseris]
MFISSNGEDDEYGIEKVVIESMRVAQAKMKVATKILEEEISVNPQSTSYIINNSKRYQNILVFQDFLKTQIQKDILDTNNLKQASFFRLRTYLVFIGFYYSIFLCGDTETSTPLYFGKLDSEGRFESLSYIFFD